MYKLAFKLKSLFIEENTLYKDNLIKELHQEHKKLFEIYTKIVETKNLRKKLKLLKKFYYEYHLHILKEDKQLYKHLLLKFTFIDDKSQFIKEKQEEMSKITDFIEAFSKSYSTIDALKNEEFEEKLKLLGEALTKRVQFEEEKLYKLYD